MSSVAPEYLPAAREALGRNSWSEAYELLSRADEATPLLADDLESFAEAAWWTGHPEVTYSARERAFHAYSSEGNSKRAAMMALNLAHDYFQKNDPSLGGGWFMRAERLLEGDEDSLEYGYLCMFRGQGATQMGEYEMGIEQARIALEMGMKYGDRDLQAYGLALQGMAKVSMGAVKEGMALIDEATVAAVSGELGQMTTGMIYCMTISICRDMADYRRAGEWTEAAKRWCERQSINGFPGVCRVHRAEIIALQGSWAEAEQEARRASDELMRFNLVEFAAIGHYEIGEIRMKMGDLPAAEESFRLAHELGRSPMPGLAMLWAAQGKQDSALSALKRALTETPVALERARILPALVEVSISADVDAAKEAADELSGIADTFGSLALHAYAHYCRAQVALALGNIEAASTEARQAYKHFNEADVPYEVARSRVLIGRICLAVGNQEEANLEFSAAANQFEKLGAAFDLRRTHELAGAVGISSPVSAGQRVVMTFMFTDIVKSTNLIEVIGDEAWEDLIRWHDKTMRAILAEHGGQEIRHQGDGFFIAFERVDRAIDCAVHIQRALTDHRKSQGFAPQVRIGMHTSEATRRGLDYAGAGIHEAARIGGLAEAGEVLLSRATLEAADSRVRVGDPRLVTLKGLAEQVEVLPLDWR